MPLEDDMLEQLKAVTRNPLMAKQVAWQRKLVNRDPIASLDDLLLSFIGGGRVAGAYNPITNQTTFRSSLPADGWVDAQNVRRHEEEHKRQFNNPGDLTSETALRIASKISGGMLEERGYRKSQLPHEVLAFMAGSKDDDYPDGPNLPHPAWNQLSDDAKAWYMRNQQSGGEAGLLDRLKLMGSSILNDFKP